MYKPSKHHIGGTQVHFPSIVCRRWTAGLFVWEFSYEERILARKLESSLKFRIKFTGLR